MEGLQLLPELDEMWSEMEKLKKGRLKSIAFELENFQDTIATVCVAIENYDFNIDFNELYKD